MIFQKADGCRTINVFPHPDPKAPVVAKTSDIELPLKPKRAEKKQPEVVLPPVNPEDNPNIFVLRIKRKCKRGEKVHHNLNLEFKTPRPWKIEEQPEEEQVVCVEEEDKENKNGKGKGKGKKGKKKGGKKGKGEDKDEEYEGGDTGDPNKDAAGDTGKSRKSADAHSKVEFDRLGKYDTEMSGKKRGPRNICPTCADRGPCIRVSIMT